MRPVDAIGWRRIRVAALVVYGAALVDRRGRRRAHRRGSRSPASSSPGCCSPASGGAGAALGQVLARLAAVHRRADPLRPHPRGRRLARACRCTRTTSCTPSAGCSAARPDGVAAAPPLRPGDPRALVRRAVHARLHLALPGHPRSWPRCCGCATRKLWLRYISRVIVLSVGRPDHLRRCSPRRRPGWPPATATWPAVARLSARGWIWLHAGNVEHALAQAQNGGLEPGRGDAVAAHRVRRPSSRCSSARCCARRWRYLLALYPWPWASRSSTPASTTCSTASPACLYALAVHLGSAGGSAAGPHGGATAAGGAAAATSLETPAPQAG